MIHETVSFQNKNIKLVGALCRPESTQPSPAVIAVHPASAGERTDPFYDHLKIELPKRGMAALIFDRRGIGESEGDFETADFGDLAEDVAAAVTYLESRTDIDGSKIGLHGTSQGAWIAPVAAMKKPEIASIVAVSACGVTPAEQMDFGVAFHLLQDGYDQTVINKVIQLRTLVNEYFRGHLAREYVAAELSRYEPESWFKNAYLFPSRDLPFDVTTSKWHYEMDYEPLSVWRTVHQPALFLFAGTDEWVPVEASMKNYQSATSHMDDVTLRRIDGTNHLMSVSSDEGTPDPSQEYLDVLLDWLTARLNP